MIQGATLQGVYVDAGENQLQAYIGLSRAKTKEGLWILAPFPLWLFNQGGPKGPEILLRRMRGDITAEQAEEECVGFLRACDGPGLSRPRAEQPQALNQDFLCGRKL